LGLGTAFASLPQTFPLLSALRCIRIVFSSLAIMRLFLLLAVIVCLSGSSSGQQRQPNSRSPAEDVQNSPASQQGPCQTTIVNVESPQPAAQAQIAKHEECKTYWPEILSAWGTITIAGLTLIYVFVTALMLRQLRIDVGIAQTAATASEIMGKASVNAERAWMTPRVEKLPQWEQYEFRVVNDGKTPGRVIEYSVEAYFIDLGQTPPKETITDHPIRTNIWVKSEEDKLLETFDRVQKMLAAPISDGPPGSVKTTIEGHVDYLTAVEIDIKPPKVHRTTFRYDWDSTANALIPNSGYWTYS